MLGAIRNYKVADFPGFSACWSAFAADDGKVLPDAAAISFAAPMGGDAIKLTNNDWIIRPHELGAELGLNHLKLVNDFEAVAHAVSRLPPEKLIRQFGPDKLLPRDGTVSVIGVGTGLGVAIILFENGVPHVIATEGGHFDFASLDAVEDAMLAHLRGKFGRVSVERLVSGPGLANIYEALAAQSQRPVVLKSDADLWAAALDGESHARMALDRLLLSYGSAIGDITLAHGAKTVVLAGGLTARMRPLIQTSGFYQRFTAKGRYERMMLDVPIRFANHDQIGLFGAAAAFDGPGQSEAEY